MCERLPAVPDSGQPYEDSCGAGVIDGNDLGQYGYEFYCAGHDAETMRRVLEPVSAESPVP